MRSTTLNIKTKLDLITPMPDDVREIFPGMLGTSIYLFALSSKANYSFFQAQLKLLRFLTYTARAQHQAVEEMLVADAKKNQKTVSDKPDTKASSTETATVSSLLTQRTFIPITDYVGVEIGKFFINKTAFQIAIELLDMRLCYIFLKYLPRTEASAQFAELMQHSVKPLKYDLRLMTNDTKIEEGNLYVRVIDGCLSYSVVTLCGQTVKDVEIPAETLPPPEPFSIDAVGRLKPQILRYAADRVQTDPGTDSLMTYGRQQLEVLKYRYANYWLTLGGLHNPTTHVQYWETEIAEGLRNIPAHAMYDFFEKTFFNANSTFSSPILNPNTAYLTLRDKAVYPIRNYNCVVLLERFDSKMEFDRNTILLCKNANTEEITAVWHKRNHIFMSNWECKQDYDSDDEEVLKRYRCKSKDKESVQHIIIKLSAAGGKSHEKSLINSVLKLFGCSAGLGFQFGLIHHGPNKPMEIDTESKLHVDEARAIIRYSGNDNYLGFTALCRIRTNQLTKLKEDLEKPPQTPAASAATISR